MKRKFFAKVTLFVVSGLAVFAVWTIGVHKTEACSYSMYGCGGYYYQPSYQSYYQPNYQPYTQSSYGYGNNYGYAPISNGCSYGCSNGYNYSPYPTYQYTYFKNPTPANSRDAYTYVQYPYQFYVYY